MIYGEFERVPSEIARDVKRIMTYFQFSTTYHLPVFFIPTSTKRPIPLLQTNHVNILLLETVGSLYAAQLRLLGLQSGEIGGTAYGANIAGFHCVDRALEDFRTAKIDVKPAWGFTYPHKAIISEM